MSDALAGNGGNGLSALARKSGLLVISASIGSGVVTFAFWFFTQPERLFRLVESWGPWVTLVFCAGYAVDRRLGQFVTTQREMASATTGLTEAVKEIAHKDDSRGREQELVLNHLARSHDTLTHTIGRMVEGQRVILSEIEELRRART